MSTCDSYLLACMSSCQGNRWAQGTSFHSAILPCDRQPGVKPILPSSAGPLAITTPLCPVILLAFCVFIFFWRTELSDPGLVKTMPLPPPGPSVPEAEPNRFDLVIVAPIATINGLLLGDALSLWRCKKYSTSSPVLTLAAIFPPTLPAGGRSSEGHTQ